MKWPFIPTFRIFQCCWIKDGMILVALCAVITIVQSYYVGDLTIYSAEFESKREALHHAILSNTPIEDTWGATGANGVNIRLLTVYSSEFLHTLTGLSYLKIYKLIDLVSIFLTLLLLFPFLLKWVTSTYSVIALLYIGTIFPLTYEFGYFHPWDRLGLLLWLVFIWAIREGKFGFSVPILILAVINKYDAIVLPGLYFLSYFSASNWRPVMVRTVGLFAVTLGIFFLLRWMIPGGFEERDLIALFFRNMHRFVEMNIRYPPLLGFLLPVLFTIVGWSVSDRFSRACTIMAFAILLGPLFFTTNFHEMRAEMGVLILMVPTAICGLQKYLSRADTITG